MSNTETINNIEDEIQNEMIAFNNAVYEGILPKGFKQKYEKAVMATPPANTKMFAATVKKIVDKKEADLCNLDVANMTNLISSVAPEIMYDNITQALKGMMELDNVRMDFNMKVKVKEQELNDKKKRLVNLSGASLSNSKIISV